MPRGDKSSYTDKQKRQAAHIEAGYREQGLSESEACIAIPAEPDCGLRIADCGLSGAFILKL